MKIVYLNIWDARVFEPLMDFFERHGDIDVFCLQEVWGGDEPIFFRNEENKRVNAFNEISSRLPEHEGNFVAAEPALDDIPPKGMKVPYGLAMFIKRGIEVTSQSHDPIFESGSSANDDGRTHRRIVQTACIRYGDSELAISNVHGLWNGKGKGDSDQRKLQSQKIRQHLAAVPHPVVLGGDFNLLPDTESLRIIKEGMVDLIEKYKVASTRTSLYEKDVKFADYVFVTPGVKVESFTVLPDTVSDHSPLLLEIE